MKKIELLAWLIFIWVLLAGCTQIIYEDPVKKVTVKVNHFLVDPKYQGFIWVFDNYVAVYKLSAETSDLPMPMVTP